MPDELPRPVQPPDRTNADTEHTSHGNALRLSEEHFQQVVTGVKDYAIFLLDATGRIVSWNEGARRIKGYQLEEILGKHFSIFYPPEAIAQGRPEYELTAASNEGAFEEEGWRVRNDGTQFWASVVLTALRDENGRLRGFLKITRDLTERRHAEEVLRQSEERFRLMVEGVQDYAIFMLDPQGHVVSWNIGAERIKGYTASEIIGKHFSVFYPPEDVARGKPQRGLQTAVEKGRTEDEGWRIRKNGSRFWADVVITALHDKERRLYGFAKVTRDLTERRRMFALEETDRQKNEFLAMLAHELRNPLAPIRTSLHILKVPGISSDAVREAHEMMERQFRHLVRLMDDLLNVSRVIFGKIDLHKERIDLAAVIARAFEVVRPVFDAGNHELVASLPPPPIYLDGDLLRLAQAIGNLLANAAKFSDQGGNVWLSAEHQGAEVVIRVRDAGVGIAPDLLPRIFDLFVQADNTLARSQGGLGVGLTVVKRLVELHGGTVTAKSAGLGQGSEFTVRLPALPEDPVTARVASSVRVGLDAVLSRRVLVVDDNVDAAESTAMLVRLWGHQVRTVYNGPAALVAMRDFRPEIVLLDIGMPGMSGYDVARHLRAEPDYRTVVLAALTGYGQEDDRRRSREAGFDFHLTKPPDPSALEALVTSPHSFSPTLA
jgi:PAS domain S-box-containing protein